MLPSYLWICCLFLPLKITLPTSRASTTFPTLPHYQVHCRRRNPVMPTPRTPQCATMETETALNECRMWKKWQSWGPNQGRFHTSTEPSACALDPASCPVSRRGIYQGEPAWVFFFFFFFFTNSVKHTYKPWEHTRYKILSPLIHGSFLKIMFVLIPWSLYPCTQYSFMIFTLCHLPPNALVTPPT
jgi:hypothetical protein